MRNPIFQVKAIQDLILNKKNIIQYSRFIDDSVGQPKKKAGYTEKIIQKQEPAQKVMIPAQKDTLFWIFYIIHYDWVAYETIHNFFTEEKKRKISFVELLREKKDILKKNKWKRTQIENELVNEKTILLTTFICLLTIFDYSYIIINNRKVYKNIIHDDKEKIKLIIKKDGEYGIYIGDDKVSKINNALENLYIIENIKKPLKGISSYKVKELRAICVKLDLQYDKMKKKDLYQLLVQNL